MINLIIIDDDEIIRKGIEADVPWAENGIHVVGSARNGLEGIELVKELQPAIILLDIKMPYMDGIEVAEQATKLFPHLKVIFLTAYEDFGFAKKALHLKVSGYVMKYEDKHVILSAVLKGRDEWIAERMEREKAEQNKALIINKFLGDLLSTTSIEEDIMDQAHSLGVYFKDEKFCLAVIGIDDYGTFSLSNNRSHLELAVDSVINITKEILYTYGNGMVFTKYNNYINIIFNYSDENNLDEIIYIILEEIVGKCKKFLGISLSIGLGNGYTGLLNISLSYSEALNALEIRNTIKKRGVIPIDSIKYNEHSQETILKKIVEFVNANYTKNILLSDISKEFYVSQSYICSLFRKHKNCTLSDCIIDIRIEKAKKLLSQTDLKFYMISEKVGYSNPQYFSMLFKKKTGHTPTEYRNFYV